MSRTPLVMVEIELDLLFGIQLSEQFDCSDGPSAVTDVHEPICSKRESDYKWAATGFAKEAR
jgi:hypothetical protein